MAPGNIGLMGVTINSKGRHAGSTGSARSAPRCITRWERAACLALFGAMMLLQAWPAGRELARAAEPRTPQPAAQRPDLVIVQAPVLRPGNLAARFPQGSRLVRLAAQEQSPQNLTPDLFTAADPRVSFDASRVLLAGKKTADSRWQIWEMNLEGTGLRQVTQCSVDCLKPAYLPRGEIIFTVLSAAAGSQIWVSKLDGSDPHPITFGPGDFQVETVLMNGTILASGGSPLVPDHALAAGSARIATRQSGPAAGRQFYTLRPDGSGLAAFRCDHPSPVIRSQAEELDNGAVVFIKSSLPSLEPGGELAWVRRGALHNAPLTSPETPVLSPQALSAERLIVARSASSGKAQAARFALYAFDTEQARFAGLIYQDPKLSSVAGVPVAAHEPPRWYWSTLNPALGMGYFICLDSHLAQDAPHGRLAIQPARVRVLSLDSAQRETRLGEAAVEKDGSFYIAVPPDRPLRFALLDAAGKVIRAQQSWIWARSGEEHGCVGCHEDRAVAPENRWPLALRSFDTPVRLGVAESRR